MRDGDEAFLVVYEERLDVLNKLIHKYAKSAAPGQDPVAAVMAYREQIGLKAAELEKLHAGKLADLRTILVDSASTTPEAMQDLARRFLKPDATWKLEVVPEKR